MLPVVYHEKFKQVYSGDPASAPGRMESVVKVLHDRVKWVEAKSADGKDILRVHSPEHVDSVKRSGVYEMAVLAAGGAVQAAEFGLESPAFGLIRPPGHHASAGSAWGFCYFNNMAVALEKLHQNGRVKRAHVLDIDLHYGDGTVNILGGKPYVTIHNPGAATRKHYLEEVARELPKTGVDIIAISAGFDQHREDWGGLLETSDYQEIGRLAAQSAKQGGAGLFALLEGGYNHEVLGNNVWALIQGMEEGWG
jgi:acetoin utilization deacetylase AcuC-like enzyme